MCARAPKDRVCMLCAENFFAQCARNFSSNKFLGKRTHTHSLTHFNPPRDAISPLRLCHTHTQTYKHIQHISLACSKYKPRLLNCADADVEEGRGGGGNHLKSTRRRVRPCARSLMLSSLYTEYTNAYAHSQMRT